MVWSETRRNYVFLKFSSPFGAFGHLVRDVFVHCFFGDVIIVTGKRKHRYFPFKSDSKPSDVLLSAFKQWYHLILAGCEGHLVTH